MALGYTGAIVDAYLNGNTSTSFWKKTPAVVTGAGIWQDLSMAPGYPSPNYYANSPLEAALLTTKGISSGGDVSPNRKNLFETMAMTAGAAATPIVLLLCDYLLYYPFVDHSISDEQVMINNITLPRYTSGEGVQMFPVVVGAGTGVRANYFVKYTNSDGVQGRTTITLGTNTNNNIIGSLPNTSSVPLVGLSGPFLPLQGKDKGVQKIESVTYLDSDSALMTFVLVKPLASFIIRGIDAPVEVNYLRDRPSLPVIEDGAYLNFIAMPNGSLSGLTLYGSLTSVWG